MKVGLRELLEATDRRTTLRRVQRGVKVQGLHAAAFLPAQRAIASSPFFPFEQNGAEVQMFWRSRYRKEVDSIIKNDLGLNVSSVQKGVLRQCVRIQKERGANPRATAIVYATVQINSFYDLDTQGSQDFVLELAWRVARISEGSSDGPEIHRLSLLSIAMEKTDDIKFLQRLGLALGLTLKDLSDMGVDPSIR